MVLSVTTKHAHESLGKNIHCNTNFCASSLAPKQKIHILSNCPLFTFDANTKPFGASTVPRSHHRPSTKKARILNIAHLLPRYTHLAILDSPVAPPTPNPSPPNSRAPVLFFFHTAACATCETWFTHHMPQHSRLRKNVTS